MKIISFNINGIRAINKKNIDGKKIDKNEINVITNIINVYEPDILILQEIKCSECNINELELYNECYPYIYMNNSSIKKGYSGIGILSKIKPLNIYYNFENYNEIQQLDYNFLYEGRIICLEFNKIFIIGCYVPNSKPNLERLDQRINIWEKLIQKYINFLNKIKPVVYCGDLNVAHQDIDIYSIKGHSKSPGFTDQERNEFSILLKECNLIDSFRYLYPDKIKYSYWSNLGRARINNKGWRLDYFLISTKIKKILIESDILDNIYGSDHAPILLELK
jgi:exodeoxyribonuclease-3